MKSHLQRPIAHQPTRSQSSASPGAGQLPGLDGASGVDGSSRRGSVLLVVIGLLGMLLLLGIAFYSFSTQEQASSQYYAEAAKSDDSGLSPDKLWEYALEQLIVGTTDTNKQNSALWGKRHSLLAGILGRSGQAAYDGFDLTPFDGAGVNVRYSTSPGFIGDPFVDLDYDGAPDVAANQALLNFNYSPAANGGTVPTIPTLPSPDTDHTSSDINTLALAFIGRGLDVNGADVSVIKPSFHRPELLRQNGAPIPNWPQNAATVKRVMRPHPNHTLPSGTARFLSATATNALGQTVQPFPFGNTATLKQGVWDLGGAPALPVVSPTYQYDADPDGDNIKEGIWMDLDFPVQTLADGRLYLPLFSFTVVDADGLINLNIAGNQTGLVQPPTPTAPPTLPLGAGYHVSRSNMGLSRSEISPAWAMLADPASDPASKNQHSIFWYTAPGTFNRMEMANSETVFLNIGRSDFSDVPGGSYSYPAPGASNYEPTKYYPGRYDELELMGRNQFTMSGYGIAGYGDGGNRNFTMLPAPGRSAQMYGAYYGDDDNDDSTPPVLPSGTYWDHVGRSRVDTNGYYFMGTSYLSMRSGTAIPQFVHPLDFWGNGTGLQAGPTGVRMNLGNSGIGVPSLWPYYSYGYSTPGTDTTGSGYVSYLNAASGGLLPTPYTAQIDEPDEMVAEWEVATTHGGMLKDEVFGPDVMLELQGTDADLVTTSLQGRVRDLAPFNFKLSSSAEQIRHQFTVLSHDRKNFGLGGMGPYSPLRSWEFNADFDSDGNFEFPPQFTSVAGTNSNEPFRQVLRQLMYVEANQTTASSTLSQLRRDLNTLLVSYDTTSSSVGAPVYRDLTPHPVSLGNSPIVAPTWNADSPTGGTPSANDQEYWARYDRQRMARDIYVFLYALGGGNDATNYTADNSGRVLYSNAQLQEMAQFAVNVVDELDRDNIVTKFEYDRNLHDGWNLDDNPYNGFADPENSVADRAVVYGVEAQQLTFSEILGIISRQVKDGSGNPVDHVATQVNDGDGMSDRFYTYMELRNASPFNVDLSNGEWQIVVQNDNGADGNPNTGDETDVVQLTLFSGNATSIIGPGALFTIGTRGGPPALDPNTPTNNLPSLFKVDSTGSPTPDFSVTNPDSWIVTNPTLPLSLDLIPTMAGSPNNTTQFLLTDGTGSGAGGTPGAGADVTTAGNFLYGGTGGNVTTAQETLSNPHIFILRRRAHPTRTRPVTYSSNNISHRDQSIDNPWVEVDRMTMSGWRAFALAMSDTATDVQTKLLPLTSLERAQPFSRGLAEAVHPPAAAIPFRAHSIGSTNSNSPGNFNQVQLHFDRDFASVVDLLSVPLYGPDQTTRRVGHPARFDESNSTSYLAQERFLRPQHHDNMASMNPPGPPGVAFDNRWYRLFEFVEVPTQTQQGLRTYPYALRNSGAVNLNTVRHRGVLAGVLDDVDNPYTPSPTVEGHFNPAYAAESVMLLDQFESGGGVKRDWWLQFLESRDGFDPLTGLILPATPAGRPFRALGFMENGINSIDDTILRGLPLDINTANAIPAPGNYSQVADRRGLFEARMMSDRTSFGGSDAVDGQTRHRLLRKVTNNTTTRSNVFAVWIQTRYFEVVKTGSDYQVGDVLQGGKDHRGFFVIDRSLPEQAYSSNLGKFDFRKFIQYRKTLQ